MKIFLNRLLFMALLASGSLTTELNAGTWTPLNNQPTFLAGANFQMLLTDGSIIVLNSFSNSDGSLSGTFPDVWKLTPDAFGSYVNGTWTQLASFPMIPAHINWPIQYASRTAPNAPNQTQYAPLYFASAVLPDGRVIFAGGEGNGPNGDFVLTNMVAIYDPVTNTWTPVNPPPFVIDQYPPRAAFAPNAIGDSASAILEDGTFFLAPKMSNQAALLDPKMLTWTEVGTSTNPGMNNEQNLTLLPSGKVLTTECYNGQFFAPEIYGPAPPMADMVNSLLYDPKTTTWSGAGSTIVPLTDPDLGEVGPAILRPDGKVVVFSGTFTGHNVLFDSKTATWSVTTPFPVGPGNEGQLTAVDTPAALLPNGNVLVLAGSYGFLPPIHFFEFTYDTLELIEQSNIPGAKNIPPFAGNMLILPNGQIMLTTATTDVEIYTPSDRSYNPAWAPGIRCSPKKVRPGKTYKIEGIRFNGMSQGAALGDDYQPSTNYPLVRITSNATGHVFYCRTHDHSFMGVASNEKVSTYFDVPANIESGESKLEVVANGIPSKPKSIYVRSSYRDGEDDDHCLDLKPLKTVRR